MTLGQFELFGVRISTASFAETVNRVLAAPDTGERLQVHFATAHSLVAADRDPQVRSALASGLVEPDGMPLVWLGRRYGLSIERVCGPDFMPALMDKGRAHKRRHYLYGGTQEVLDHLVQRLTERFPDLEIVGTHAPPFGDLADAEQRDDLEHIRRARPDYVWVGLGAPKQDLWIAAHRGSLDASALLAVGAAFDFHAGRRRRAPAWMQRTGTEWLYRLASEPRRLAGRYTVTSLRFGRLVVSDALSRRRIPDRR